ncbi:MULTISPECIES: cation:proton antiporter domain-containing protein [Bradyrhizobium]|uniref:CPA2 family monovalent cation:H+ antiporter-2 n=1 Tax=Bradyrhizobium ottawaense TaxID=931866 RepID=A0ABV4FKS8_9BRAD|nr:MULTISPECIES: cation:proton antiporter [Bradyrhizobium]MBR1290530.1 cation:proton antiporter [Bradyrhizobium ottawaense]MDA9416829.1 potassium transporter TrkA [Bradyrhizobium sp. CCBAU 25360]MDA9484560.1 potassium transporter TrkA [Bradyrhizobium sp. CCBAU 11445]WLB44928.1 cation:proton antiporter [Bradyrhizobium ottawaense]WQN82225.1 cation:proton antiporter [Bradyrhizobium ottawaense]
MTTTININAYSDALVVLGTAGVVVPIVRHWGINPVLGYLGAGAILGPLGLGSLVQQLPLLYWVTVADAQNVEGIANLGIVFLLFLIGLELSFRRLVTMRRLVFGLGGLQVLATSAMIFGVTLLSGQSSDTAVILGASLALSSTAIVLELLSTEKRLATTAGRASFSVLLAQDLAVVPILVFVSVLGAESGGSVLAHISSAILKAALAVAVLTLLGRLLMRPLFQMVAGTHSTELFVAATLFVIVGAGIAAHQAGLSMALGAFVAGLMLAETEYGKAIEATVEPFKGLLLGIFFFTVGMAIDFRVFMREPGWLLAAVIGILVGKAIVLIMLGRLFRLSWATAIEIGFLLGPVGEFAFVSIGMAAAGGLIEPRVSSFAVAITAVTMALTPLLGALGRRLAAKLGPERSPDPELAVRPPGDRAQAIVVGYGRVGKVVCSLLTSHGLNYIAVDHEAVAVARDRRDGHKVYFGDATELGFLEACGLMQTTGVIITIQSRPAIDAVVERIRAVRPDVLIVSRARDADHARHLYAIGATDAVPETIEASLQLSEAALVGLGVAVGNAIASVHEKRDEFRLTLQQAARIAGQEKVRPLDLTGRRSPR